MVASVPAQWTKLMRAEARRTVRRLNDVYVLTSLSADGLKLIRESLSATKRRAMDVVVLDHSGAEMATTRRKKHMRRLLHTAIERTQVEYALQSVVSEAEAFIASLLRHVLLAYPRKLLGSEKKVDLSVVIECDSRDEIISRLIDAKIAAILYGSPSDYLKAVGDIVSGRVPEELAGKFSEVKATRDLIVHAQGIANDLYIRKSAGYSRAASGTLVPIDRGYLRHGVAAARNLVIFLSLTASTTFVTGEPES